MILKPKIKEIFLSSNFSKLSFHYQPLEFFYISDFKPSVKIGLVFSTVNKVSSAVR